MAVEITYSGYRITVEQSGVAKFVHVTQLLSAKSRMSAVYLCRLDETIGQPAGAF